MNKDDAALFLPLVQALADGKTIQGFNQRIQKWEDLTQPAFDNWQPEKFRIKPEPTKPREWWVNVYNGHIEDSCFHESREIAEKEAADNRIELIHLREVLPENANP